MIVSQNLGIRICSSGRCDSTCMSKLADGEMCNENSDCTNNNCLSGICGGPKCDGAAEILAQDINGNSLKGLSLYVNGSFNKTTNDVGQVIVNFDNVLCGRNFNFTMKCSNNITICAYKNSSIDVNNDVDYLSYDCSICTSTRDLIIEQSDVYVNVSNNQVKVEVNSYGINRSVRVNLKRQTKDFFVVDNLNRTILINSFSKKNATFNLSTIDSTDFLHIYVDNNNSVREDDETNNYVFRVAVKPVKAYLNVSLSPSVLNNVVKEYLSSYVDLVNTQSNADVVIDVGSYYAIKNEGINNKKIIGPNGKIIVRSFGGIVQSLNPINDIFAGNKPHILVYGNGIEGDIAATKKLINKRSLFLDKNRFLSYEIFGAFPDKVEYINDTDESGIEIFTLMNLNETKRQLKLNDDTAAQNVKKILYGNNYETSIRAVKTTNGTSYNQSTILRIKHVNSDLPSGFKNAKNISSVPVVFSGGIFSDLTSWEENNGLAKKMSKEGWDVWEIEMTGGPYNDCYGSLTDNCPNYRYSDLVNHYWPASIAGIMKYSNKSKIDYVGHSNGGRVALSSLNNHSLNGKTNAGYYFNYSTQTYKLINLTKNPVRKFFGVAVPGPLNAATPFTESLSYKDSDMDNTAGNISMNIVDVFSATKNTRHVRKIYFSSLVAGMVPISVSREATLDPIATLAFGSEYTISNNLMRFYNDLANNPNSTFNVSKVNVSELYLFNSVPHDVILPAEDGNHIIQNTILINSTNKNKFNYSSMGLQGILRANHAALKSNEKVTEEIRVKLR